MQKNQNKNHKIATFISNNLEFPLEGVTDVPVVELKGNKEAFVHGCKAIVEYNPNYVIFDANHYQIKVAGERLTLNNFSFGCMSISGLITDINLC